MSTKTPLKEKPILFSAPMVRALLAGTKTQTRRLVKFEYTHGCMTGDCPHDKQTQCDAALADYARTESPYKIGEHRWVREAIIRHRSIPQLVGYVADGCTVTEPWEKMAPSIHMPRKWCRINLEVTDVRVQRLQHISEEDALAEGLSCVTKDGSLYKYGIADMDGLPGTDDIGWPWTAWDANPVLAYRTLWQSINGVESWNSNPWVWAVTFERIGVSR